MDKYKFTDEEMKNVCELIINAAGLALRAGKCSVGTELCVDDIRTSRAKLVLVPQDVSENTKKRISDSTSFHKVPVLFLPCSKAFLAVKLGKRSPVSCAAITDEGFVRIIDKIYVGVHTRHTEVQQ